MNEVITKHKLDFESAPWPLGCGILIYRIGTCHGQYMYFNKCLYLISIVNDQRGNGHLDDVFQWFEYAARRDCLPLVVAEVMNKRFKKHLINKRGFKVMHDRPDNVIKYWI